MSTPTLTPPTSAPAPVVQLDHLWLTSVVDPRQSLRLKFLVGSQLGWPTGVAVTQYAAGRVRASRGPRGAAQKWTPQLGLMPVESAWALVQLAGEPHWARDPLGGKIACVWEAPDVVWRGREHYAGQQMALAALTLQQYSHREG